MTFQNSVHKRNIGIILAVFALLIIVSVVFLIMKGNSSQRRSQQNAGQQLPHSQNGGQAPTNSEAQSQLKQLQSLQGGQQAAPADQQKAQQQLDQLKSLQKQAAAQPVSAQAAQAQLDQLNKLRTSGK